MGTNCIVCGKLMHHGKLCVIDRGFRVSKKLLSRGVTIEMQLARARGNQ